MSNKLIDLCAANRINKINLGEKDITLNEFIAVVRYGAKVYLSSDYTSRVKNSRKLIEKFIREKRIIYGVTTGFGYNHTKIIDEDHAEKLQKNILLSHACSVGEPLEPETVRGILLMMLLNLGQGYSGVKIETLQFICELLNKNIIPFAPSHGSVGYLSPEAHISLIIIGKGKAWYKGTLISADEALQKAQIKAPKLGYKEGLSLISGTTSVTAMAAIAIYDSIKSAINLDIAGAMSLETLKGTLHAFHPGIQRVRRHSEQKSTANNISKILKNSEIAEKYINYRLQDALSLRCIPQLHGAAKKTLKDAYITIMNEMNSCCDNPIIYPTGNKDGEALIGCNADGAYVGIEADSICIADVNLGKMSERRIQRLLNENESGLPAFLIQNPGLNSGLMITQYAAAGILGEMRILASPATIDNVPTCANQEDYVSMGYNASKKALHISQLLENIIALEVIASSQGIKFLYPLKPSPATSKVYSEIRKIMPEISEDIFVYPYIEEVKKLIHEGVLIKCIEEEIGPLEF
ncbi:histidine ammonia-lyase [Clostridium sp. WILCCON 0269]|uniref:Histidine ammonia-lyase n=1 Tax=Candidatus Clostridium eludens TaxID=3381663 RepID=A0ABW8SGI2_9CLOT